MQNFQNLQYREIRPFFIDAVQSLGVNVSDSAQFKEISEFDIACKCPICGDSRHGRKQRLHFYQKGNVINMNCFNGDCSVKNYSPYKFFRDFAPKIFESYKRYYKSRFFLQISEKVAQANAVTLQGSENLFDISEVKTEISDETKTKVFNLLETFEASEEKTLEKFSTVVKEIKEIDKGFEFFQELRNQNDLPVFDDVSKLLQSKQFERLLEPLTDETIQYLQSRNLSEFSSEFFTVQSDTIFNFQGKDLKIPKNAVICPLKNPFSMFLKGVWIRFLEEKRFFIFLVQNEQKYWFESGLDFSKPVVVCESIFDALSVKKLTNSEYNVCATLGVAVSSEMREILKKFPKILFAFDFDKAGAKGMLLEVQKFEDLGYFETVGVLDFPEIKENFVKDFNDFLKISETSKSKELFGAMATLELKKRLM